MTIYKKIRDYEHVGNIALYHHGSDFDLNAEFNQFISKESSSEQSLLEKKAREGTDGR